MRKILIIITCLLSISFNIISVSALTKAPVDVTKMDIFEIQDAIDKGLLNYETLVRIYLDRINEYNSKYKAIITINKNIVEEAKECDKNYNKERSVLYCIPVLVKDNIDVKGMPTTAGTKSLSDSYPREDAEIIKKLKEKGALIIGKANMSEFAFTANASTSSYGTVKNAYNIGYSSYGSSGGSAVGVAASLAPISIGTDTNSSVRAPSSANNVYGMRPTLGLLSSVGMFNYDITRDTAGPITKTAKENAILLAIMAGFDEKTYINESASLDGKVIGVLTEFVEGDSSVGLLGANDKVKKKFYDTIELLKQNNVTIINIDNFYSNKEQQIGNSTISGWTMCNAFNKYIQNTSSSIKNFYDLANSTGHIYSLSDYIAGCNRPIERIDSYEQKKLSFNENVKKVFNDYDLDALIYPTTGNILTKVGGSNYSSNCSKLSPVLGLPAISIPMGDIDGLYYGMDLVGLKNSENVLYDIAISYNEINNTSILPDISPTLYDVPQEVVLLNEYYLSNNGLEINMDSLEYENYNNTLEEIKNFYINYNDYENINEEAKYLLTKLENSVIALNKLSFNIKKDNLIKGIIMTIVGLVGLVFCLMLKITNNLNNKKRKG